MKITGKEDLRIQKTMAGIHAAFEEMICEMDYDSITVKELCARAMINKKTFYRYYECLDDLLMEYQEDISNDYLKRVRGLSIPDDLEQITREFFRFSASQGKAYENISCSNAYWDIQASMQRRVMTTRSDDDVTDGSPDSDEQSVFMSYVTESTLAIYRQWVASGKRIPIERIEEMAVELVCRGSQGFENAKRRKRTAEQCDTMPPDHPRP